MCREGGCGACIINVQTFNPTTQTDENLSINSVIVKIFTVYNKNPKLNKKYLVFISIVFMW